MNRSTKLTCAAYSALFAATVLTVFSLRGGMSSMHSLLYMLVLTALPVLGYLLSRRHTLLAFAFGFIPTLPLLAFFLTGRAAWGITAAVLFTIYLVTYNIRPASLPEPPRRTTQNWVSSLILAEVMLILIMLAIIR